MKWTTEQQNVIDFRDRNILVSAAAGSGKTAVLVERIIQKITDKNRPVDIDRLLVVTFTNAAAAEMKERVGNAIEKLMEEFPEDENLKRQQTLIHNAQITTIDSFCLYVVRNHFEEIGLDPNFRIADTGELKLLEMDVLDELFEQEYELALGGFLHLVDAYSTKTNNKAVKEMVYTIYNQSSSSPWPKEWIASLANLYHVENVEALLATDLMRSITAQVKRQLSGWMEKLQGLQEVALSEDGPTAYAENLAQDLEQFEGLDEVSDYIGLGEFCRKMSFSNLKRMSAKDIRNEAKKEEVQNGRNAIKKEISGMIDRYFAFSPEELVEQLGRMRLVAEELIRLTLAYMERMDGKKRQKHIMSFSDIEHAALHILVDEETKELRPTAVEFQELFKEIMIDEYQDSNQVQEEIMCAISGESTGQYNMFMVGDVKQSIYRFRLARPELFMEKYATYDLTESKKQRIDLHKNFRSRAEVLDFTNDMFYKIMAPDLGSVAYDADAALYCGAAYSENPDMKAEVLLYETDGAEEAGDIDSLSNRQLEARMIGKRITELMKTLRVTDKASGEPRALRYSDIVILLRGVSTWGGDFVSVLEDCGIPAHVATSTGYFSAVEVQTVLSLLKILDNPYQDIPMAAVLKSPIVGLDNEELAEISLSAGAGGFAEAALKSMQLTANSDGEVEDAVADAPDDLAATGKLRRFGEIYRSLRKRIADTPIHQLIELVLEETGYGDFVKAMPAGAQRRANLDMLVEKAISYEKTSYKGLFHFVRYIDQMQKYEVDFGEADVSGEGEDVVRIMTIHKSKGLEFPVVFVSGISKKFNESDSNARMVIHPDMGLGLDEMQVEPRVKRKCLIRSEIAERIRRDNLGEELRVLYVALTRAKEKLILTGTVKNADALYKKHRGNVIPEKPLDFDIRVGAKSYLDWIVPGVLSYPDKYEFSFMNAEDLVLDEVRSRAQKDLGKAELLQRIAEADEALVQELAQSFAYTYPYKSEVGRKSKYSVSELKHASMVENYDRMEGEAEVPEFLLEEREAYIPEFAQEFAVGHENGNGINRGALRGTAVHRVMACLDFKRLLQIDTSSHQAVRFFLEEELARMLRSKRITEEMEQLIFRNSICNFLMSPLAKRMAEADARGDLFTEKPFVMDYEGVLVQGIIDVFWLEGNRIVLMDYKTDRVNAPEELTARYETQLQLYAQALQRVFSTDTQRIEQTESLIYSFNLDMVLPIEERI